MFRSKQKNQKGFTLVEVIVVAVIVAAMAAVAVPLYLGYIESSRKNSASNAAGSAASFCGACRNSGGDCQDALTGTGGGTLTCSSNTATIQIPSDIIVDHTAPEGNGPGLIRGRHAQSMVSEADSAFAVFNY